MWLKMSLNFTRDSLLQSWTCLWPQKNLDLELTYYLSDLTIKWFKDTVMQIEKAQVNDRLSVLKVSWKFRILIMYNFALFYLWNLLFS